MQTKDLSTAMPAAPILVMTAAPDSGDRKILGLSLLQRTEMVARRAGYEQVFLLTQQDVALPGVAAVSDWSRLATALASFRTAPVVIASAAMLAELNSLEQLAETRVGSAWAELPRCFIMIAADRVPDVLAALNEEGGAHDLRAVQDKLARRFGPPEPIPASIAPMIVTTAADVHIAERRLLRSLVKDTDGFMARHVERPISLQIVRRLALTSITPNQITMISVAIGLAGAPFFISALWPWQTLGALLFLLHSIVDGCDGELARLRFQESRWGGVLDFWGDNIVHIVTFACMAVGWSLSVSATWPLWLGAAAVIGNVGSAALVYWRQMRAKDDSGPLFTSVAADSDRRLAGLLDAASRRDFIYLVLVLAFLGKSDWFLLLAALGTPVFFFLLIFLAMRERVPDMPSTSGV
jgi:phosphatidylglycerophosphate synthase